MSSTTFQLLVDFCNANIGKLITRQQILQEIGTSCFRDATIDSYRRLLTRAGYLDSRGAGIYFVNRRCKLWTTTQLLCEIGK